MIPQLMQGCYKVNCGTFHGAKKYWGHVERIQEPIEGMGFPITKSDTSLEANNYNNGI